MKRHLFLTGEKQVGKSTLIRRLLAGYPKPVGGFVTVKATDVFPDRVSLHLLSDATGQVPSPDNFLFFCDAPAMDDCLERFDRLGCAALTVQAGTGLLLMDELGPKEEKAMRFHTAVLSALDGDIPVLGVLQKSSSPFLQTLATRPDVQILEVTPDNRDTLPDLLTCLLPL